MVSGKVVVITGASSGIGAALAKQLGAQGNKLALAARREDRLNKVAAQSGDSALAVVTDVRRRAEIERLRDRALAEFGQVDVWVSNAGRGIGRRVMELTDEEFDEMVAVNLKSVWYGMQAIIPHFKERGKGYVINVSSALSRVPFATYRSIYAASKAAMNLLTAHARLDLRDEYPDIHLSVVLPGFVATEFAASALGGTPHMPSSGAVRVQSADEVAAAMIDLIEHPAPELYTNPGLVDVMRRYYQDVAAFEAGMA